jgi:hypothetical protein
VKKIEASSERALETPIYGNFDQRFATVALGNGHEMDLGQGNGKE